MFRWPGYRASARPRSCFPNPRSDEDRPVRGFGGFRADRMPRTKPVLAFPCHGGWRPSESHRTVVVGVAAPGPPDKAREPPRLRGKDPSILAYGIARPGRFSIQYGKEIR